MFAPIFLLVLVILIFNALPNKRKGKVSKIINTVESNDLGSAFDMICGNCDGSGMEYYCANCYTKAELVPDTEHSDGDFYCPKCMNEEIEAFNIENNICTICHGKGRVDFD